MKSEWRREPLGSLISYMSKGITPSYATNESRKTILVLNQKCNRNFCISFDAARENDLEKKSVPHERILRQADILINSTGTGTAGRIAQLYEVPRPMTVDGHMIIIRGTSEIDPFYLGYALKSKQAQIEALAEGSTGQTELNRNRLCSEIIVDYPVEQNVQRYIADVFIAIDRKIQTNNALNDNLQQQATALFKSWFSDFEPFGAAMPNDWKSGAISDLSEDVVCGKTPSTKKSEYYGGDIPFITIPDMHGNTYVLKTERCLSSVGASAQAGKTLPIDSVCVSCIGTAGLVSLVASPSQTNQQINSIIPKKSVSPYFVYLLMITLAETIQRFGSGGSTICNLNKTQFSNIAVIVPPNNVIKSFDRIVRPIFKQILHNQVENASVIELRDTLLPKLMSGEQDVSGIKL